MPEFSRFNLEVGQLFWYGGYSVIIQYNYTPTKCEYSEGLTGRSSSNDRKSDFSGPPHGTNSIAGKVYLKKTYGIRKSTGTVLVR